MAHLHKGCDPSSSLDKDEKISRREALGLISGAVAAASLVACGQGEHRPTPENDPSSVTSLSPSESPSASASSSETIDPELLAREEYEQIRKEFEGMTLETFYGLPYEKRIAPYENDHAFAKKSGRIQALGNDLYNPPKGIRPSKYCMEPALETDSPEAVAAKVLSPLVAALDSFPMDPDYMRMVASAAVYGDDPELREYVLNERLFENKISGPEYDGRKAIVSTLEARIKSYETGKPTAEMFPILEPRFGGAEPYVDPITGETLLTKGLQIFTIAQPSNTKIGIPWRVVKNKGLWQIVDNKVSNLKAALD